MLFFIPKITLREPPKIGICRVTGDYGEPARNLIGSGKINADTLVTHKFGLADFNKALSVQGNPSSGAMKVVINFTEENL